MKNELMLVNYRWLIVCDEEHTKVIRDKHGIHNARTVSAIPFRRKSEKKQTLCNMEGNSIRFMFII